MRTLSAGLRERLGKGLQREHVRHPVATALLAGGNGNLLPVLDPTLCPIAGQFHDGAPAGHRLHPGRTELHGLLHDPVHLVGCGETLHQGDLQGRLALRRAAFAQHCAQVAPAALEHGLDFDTAAIEQDQPVPLDKSQHTLDMMCDGRRQRDRSDRIDRQGAKETWIHRNMTRAMRQGCSSGRADAAANRWKHHGQHLDTRL
jgi:hypothetical protein